MDLSDKIADLSVRIKKQRDHCKTEEAVKTAFVLPFLQALGYDVFNPLEVRPEFIADIGTKKGEKVDYAISLGGEIQVLIECKPIGAKLQVEHAGQLFRYFSVTSARFGVLTDGIRYCFYTDLDATNKMDSRPFFVIDLENIKGNDISNLKKFAKDSFDVESIVSTAADMKYQRALTDELKKEFSHPSDDFVRVMASRVYNGRFTSAISEKFTELLRIALADYIRERVDARLIGALETQPNDTTEEELANEDHDGIETTDQEIDAYRIIQAIAAEVLESERVVLRDGKSYCAILLDNNNRKPIARLHFNNSKKLKIQVFNSEDPPKIDLDKPSDIYNHKSLVLDAVTKYLSGTNEPNEITD